MCIRDRDIAGKKIIVDASKPGDKFTTLDGKERELPAGCLLYTSRCV